MLDHQGPIKSHGVEPASRTASTKFAVKSAGRGQGETAPHRKDAWEGRGRLLRLMGKGLARVSQEVLGECSSSAY